MYYYEIIHSNKLVIHYLVLLLLLCDLMEDIHMTFTIMWIYALTL